MKRLAVIVVMILVAGCEENMVDDQRLSSGTGKLVVNPMPKPSFDNRYEKNNRRHRVLVGIIDSGTDYNHPGLVDSIHFDLDAVGIPVGAGYDFIGEDRWPSPYIARTEHNRKGLDDTDLMILGREAVQIRTELLTVEPRLFRWLDPRRHISQERKSGISHGTHVAGLVANGRERVGIVPYRVLPMNGSKDKNHDYMNDFVQNFERAVNHARYSGVRIVNVSLGSTLKVPSGTSGWKMYHLLKGYFERMEKTIKAAPEILFVIAAGNSGYWVDGTNVSVSPCGVKAANTLCVGSLGESGMLSGFTNMPFEDMNLVFAKGEDLESTVPYDFCTQAADMVILNSMADYPKKAIPEIYEKCLSGAGYEKMTGTSMASPMVAGFAADILASNPTMSPVDVIRSVLGKARTFRAGRKLFLRLDVRDPVWKKG